MTSFFRLQVQWRNEFDQIHVGKLLHSLDSIHLSKVASLVYIMFEYDMFYSAQRGNVPLVQEAYAQNLDKFQVQSQSQTLLDQLDPDRSRQNALSNLSQAIQQQLNSAQLRNSIEQFQNPQRYI